MLSPSTFVSKSSGIDGVLMNWLIWSMSKDDWKLAVCPGRGV
jgi:hypothetical protein